MSNLLLPLLSLAGGALIGSILTVNASIGIAKYLSIAILAAMDSVLGGVRALLEDTYDGLIMLSGFVTNALLAMALAFLGTQIGIDMFMAATICFALRIFSNLAFIRRDLITRYREKSKASIRPKIRFIPKPKAAKPDPTLENTLSSLLDAIPQDAPAAVLIEDDEQAPVKVKAIVSPAAKNEKGEKE